MLATFVPEFLKNVLSLLETSTGTDGTNRDEKMMEYILGFIAKIFKNMEGSVTSLRLSPDFKKSKVEDLVSINEDLLKTVACFDPSTKTTIENLTLRMKLSNVSSSTSVFDKDNGSELINFGDLVVVDSFKYFREPESAARCNNPVQDLSISASVSFDSTLRANHYTEGELKAELQDYKVHCLTVPKYTLSNVGTTVKEALNIAVLEFSDLVLVEGSFAIDRMLWHSVINKNNVYQCLVCSKEMRNKNDYNDHILRPLHLSLLSSNKIWIPSSQMCGNVINKTNKTIQCCLCADVTDIPYMEKHLQSRKHLQNNKANNKGDTLLSQLKPKILKESMVNQVYADAFTNLHDQHEINKNENGLSCGICGTSITSDMLENLYVHISGHRHRRLYDNSLRSKFEEKRSLHMCRDTPGKSYRGFMHMYENKNLSYCIICNILIDGSSLDEVNQHIMSHSHSSLLTLYLTKHKLPPLKNLNINMDANKDLEPYNPKVGQYVNSHIPQSRGNKPIYEPKVILETSNKVILDSNIVIDKCSWNVMRLEHYNYYCGPCCSDVEMRNFYNHISSNLHRVNMEDWHVMKSYPTIKKGNKCKQMFCMSCIVFLNEPDWLLHAHSEDHKIQSKKLNVDSNELKKLLNVII